MKNRKESRDVSFMGKMKLTTLKSSTKQPSHVWHSLQGETPIFPAFSSDEKYNENEKKQSPIKEMSVLSFLYKFKKTGYDGSMTVEAALILPLFLFFLLNLLWIIEIYSLHSTLKSSLREVGRELSIYAYAYDSIVQEEDDTGLEAFLENVAFSYLYVKGRVEDLAGGDYLDASPLTYGRDGLLYVESSILQQEDIIDLVVTYQVSPFIDIVGFFPGRFFTRYYGRAWTGYAVSGEGEENTGEEYVYVAENAEVYHLSRNCTHISLSIEECTSEEVDRLRNEDGGRYRPCELCVTDGQGRLYIARNGDRYHQKLECSGLKRTITVMLRSEAEKYYRLCSRCGK